MYKNLFEQGSVQVIGYSKNSVASLIEYILESNAELSLVHKLVSQEYSLSLVSKVTKVPVSGNGSMSIHLSTKNLPVKTVVYIADTTSFRERAYGVLRGTISNNLTIKNIVILFPHDRYDYTDIEDIVETFNDLYLNTLIGVESEIIISAYLYNENDRNINNGRVLEAINHLVSDVELQVLVEAGKD